MGGGGAILRGNCSIEEVTEDRRSDLVHIGSVVEEDGWKSRSNDGHVDPTMRLYCTCVNIQKCIESELRRPSPSFLSGLTLKLYQEHMYRHVHKQHLR